MLWLLPVLVISSVAFADNFPIKRSYPPLLSCPEKLSPRNLFEDLEILRIQPILHYESFNGHVVGIAKGGKHILQQTGRTGSAPAAAAMLLMDYGKSFVPYDLRSQQGNARSIDFELSFGGLKALHTVFTTSIPTGLNRVNFVKPLTLASDEVVVHERIRDELYQKLRLQIEEFGPGIFSIDGSLLRNHYVIVDSISNEELPVLRKVSLRDPYHGWSIEVPLSVFMEAGQSTFRLIQVDTARHSD